jgi:hypothetical protein
MKSYLFSVEAVGDMLAESFRRGDQRETGGPLVGIEHSRIVTHALSSTRHAERTPMMYYQSEEDTRILNGKLRRHQAEGRDYLGQWHRHLSGFHQLSPGDLSTSREILESPNYKINRLLMVIVTPTAAERLPIFTYVVSLQGSDVVVNDAEFTILPLQFINHVARFLR